VSVSWRQPARVDPVSRHMSWGPCVRRMGDLLYHAMDQGPADHESRLLYGTSLVSVARLKKTQGMFAIIKLRVRGALVKLIFGVLESQMKTQHIPRPISHSGLTPFYGFMRAEITTP
jgi:hypothetical protein